jgi:adenosylcobinamide-phosphate synthase
MAVELAFFALLIEVIFGYPDRLLRAIGHPVIWMGKLIELLDGRLNREGKNPAQRRTAGIFAVLLLIGVVGALASALQHALLLLPLGIVVAALLGSTLIAQRSLHAHVARVATALDASLAQGRAAVAQIVGRDTAELDTAGVSRAAIESLAENFSDGVVAPLFWIALGGLTGGALYKAINTADSMVGHKNERYLAFGWAAARLDDLVNLPASRLSALWLIAAAATSQTASAREAWNAVRRDAGRHRSPNAGWPEAAMAGALGLKLAGPRVYGETRVDDAFMGEGRLGATAADIRRGLALYRRAAAIEIIALCGLALIARV